MARPTLYAPLATEAVGTLVLVYAVGMVLVFPRPGADPALAHGLAIAAFASAALPISGGYLNPAMAFAAWVSRRLGGVACAAIVASQTVGALLGVWLVRRAVTSFENGPQHVLAVPIMPPMYPPGEGVAALLPWFTSEMLLTFAIAFTFLVSAHHPRIAGRLGHIPYGLATAGCLIAASALGAAFNPARWLALVAFHRLPEGIPPYDVAGGFTVFVAGPLVGAALAGLAWQRVSGKSTTA